MPKDRKSEIKLPSLDELFSSQEERDDAKLKRIFEIPIDQIDPFPDHPFKVRDDEDMQNLIESIRAQGVLTPCMVRKKKDGRYELISGHRRKRACELLGMDTLRCEMVELSKDEATIIMTESNFQRSTILPSFAVTTPFRISQGTRGVGSPPSCSGHTRMTLFSSISRRTFSFRLLPPLYLQFSPARQALTMIFIFVPPDSVSFPCVLLYNILAAS